MLREKAVMCQRLMKSTDKAKFIWDNDIRHLVQVEIG